ncbi:MAG: hypothetical protein HYX91_03445 [Chloroflexi bacterium]|nr:hypothetical protein [Chloroflexota bacterium]
MKPWPSWTRPFPPLPELSGRAFLSRSLLKASARRAAILVMVTAVFLLGTVLLSLAYSESGMASQIGRDLPWPDIDLSGVRQSVVEDAAGLGAELFGGYRVGYEEFTSELLAAYVEARDKDFVIVFNPGGWGWNRLESSPGWYSIITGITSELEDLGYSSLLMDYRRTANTFWGRLDEFGEAMTFYPNKGEYLARRVEFLTRNIPDLKVIVAGESVGTIISDKAMDLLRDNAQVYSIQTGPPFWHKPASLDRTLVLDDNGRYPDVFTRADFSSMIWTSLKGLLGIPPPPEKAGRIMNYVMAPGHDYRWQYPDVYGRITEFLRDNFGLW